MRRQLGPVSAPPKDFHRFWRTTLDELENVPVELTRDPSRTQRATDLILEDISFASLGGARIHGYVLRPREERNCPLVVHAHGYGSCCSVQWDWGRAGLGVVGIDVRGFGRSADALPNPSKWGYVLSGIASPETSVLRGAVCDYLRAAHVGRMLLAPRGRRTVFYGRSFGGGLAVMAEGVGQVADFLALAVPTFGWAEGRHFFVRDGSGQEINSYLRRHPDLTEDVMLVLRYFDSTHLAGLVRCPALVGVGLEDAVVPANTVYAIANRLRGPVEIMEFPVSHTDRPEEKRWEAFEARWERLAADCLPSDFGRDPATAHPV